VASGSASVGSVFQYYEWASTSTMVADVQSWLDNPATNDGWLIKEDTEASGFTARRYTSGEGAAAQLPQLVIDYIPEPICGDGILGAGEACDDGNTANCDGCRGDCSAVETGCGDGFLCGAEVCDDGNTANCDGCRGDCSAVETGCGDGFLCGAEV